MPIYVIRAGDSGPVKIGVATDVKRRIAGFQTSHPERLHLLHMFDGGRDEERALHERFKVERIKGEWFNPIPEILRGDFGLTPMHPPQNKKRVYGGGWTDETYRRFRAQFDMKNNDPERVARRKAAGRLRSATHFMRSGSVDAARAIRRLASSPGNMRAKLALADALQRLEKAHAINPNLVANARQNAAGSEHWRNALAGFHGLVAVLQERGAL